VQAEEVVLIPARIAHMFQTLLEQLAQGRAVTIVPNDALLTTQDAADLLEVSRPYLIKLLAKEHVAVHAVVLVPTATPQQWYNSAIHISIAMLY
jgi:hypothetical protein